MNNPKNLLLIMSDEHNPRVMGCAGHAEILTPHLDALAASGTRFTNAVSASPICVPARAAMATGRPIFETGYWDNVDGYDGRTPSWHHVLRHAGHEVVSIGKLHYRGWEGDDYGFSESLLPMHLHNGRGEVKMLLRNPPVSIGDGSNMLRSAGAGESDYTRYDEQITRRAVQWLHDHSSNKQKSDKSWVLSVNLVAPHFPLTAPQQFFDLYANKPLQLPKGYTFGIDENAHPFIQQYARFSGYNDHFKTEDDVRRALCGYYGLVSYLDAQVGRLIKALEEAGLTNDTRIIYFSDHGDNNGARGLWGKSTMYKESVGIPLILSGEGIAAGQEQTACVSHVDIFNTVLDGLGVDLSMSTASPLSESLFKPLDENRMVLSEYHTVGSKAAVFMIQDSHTKYVHYCDHPSQLFDLDADPEEMNDLAAHPAHKAKRDEWERRLRTLCDPEAVDQKAKLRQRELIDFYGGEAVIKGGQGIGGYTPSPLR